MSKYTNVVLKVQGTQEHTVIGGKYVVAANNEAPTAYVTGSDYAHLFAAAPELLEALKAIIDDDGSGIDLFTKARAAIVKAVGE